MRKTETYNLNMCLAEHKSCSIRASASWLQYMI